MFGFTSRRCVCAAAAFFAAFAGILADARAQNTPSFQESWRSGTPATVTGVLTIMYADDFDGRRFDLLHVIRDEQTGKSYLLRFERGAPSRLRSGARVRITGRAAGSEIYIAAGEADSTTILSSAPSGSLGATTALPGSEQRTLVMLANFSDTSVSCSADTVNSVMFTEPSGLSVNGLYTASSLGKVSLTGAVVGPYTVSASSMDACDVTGWADTIDAQAASSGIDLTAYTHKVYVMPQSLCAGAGMGTVGGAPSRAWVFNCTTQGVYAHEIGHNLGMDHASTPTQEYGDSTDPMAVASWMLHGVNAPHRHQLGWLPTSAVQLVAQDGVYNVAPLAADPATAGAPQAVMIRKPDTGEYYYLSYRVRLGVDSYIDGWYYDRLSVHRYKGDGSPSRTFALGGLADGERFADQTNGITVTLISHTTTQATVQVQFSESSCTPAAPATSFAPQSQTVPAGTPVGYTLSLTNGDSAGCSTGTFALNAGVPAGWTGTMLPASLSVPPGATAQATLTLTSPPETPPGAYGATATAADAAQPVHNASATAAYVVPTPPDTIPPSSPQNLTAIVISKKKQVQLGWMPSSDNVAVAGYRVLKNGSVVATTTSTSWTDTSCNAGSTNTYVLVAYDGAGNVSAPSNAVTATIAGKGR